jgi:hypothetical protein
MIDLEAVIQHFGPNALRNLIKDYAEVDAQAIKSLNDKQKQGRHEAILNWLHYYRVLRGIKLTFHHSIADVIIQWVDNRAPKQRLITVQAITEAHTQLEEQIAAKYLKESKKNRHFISLASKALWLCYPYDIPIYDGYAQTALYMISSFVANIPKPLIETMEYGEFVYVWKTLYERCYPHIQAIN